MTATILVADDDLSTREGLAGFLDTLGYDVVTAADGDEALALCRRDPPQLVFADLDMPKCRGEALLDELRVRYPDTALAVITGESTRDIGRRAASLGVTYWFTKPLDLKRIEAAVMRVLGAASSRRGPRRAPRSRPW